MRFMKGTVPFAITMYPLNYVKISIVAFAILTFTLCLQNSGENTAYKANSYLLGGGGGLIITKVRLTDTYGNYHCV